MNNKSELIGIFVLMSFPVIASVLYGSSRPSSLSTSVGMARQFTRALYIRQHQASRNVGEYGPHVGGRFMGYRISCTDFFAKDQLVEILTLYGDEDNRRAIFAILF